MGKGLSITAFIFSFIFPVLGLILGIVAYKKAKEDPEGLRGLAIAAIIIGGIFTLVSLIILIFIGLVWNQVSGTIEEGSEQINFATNCFTIELNIDSADSNLNKIIISRTIGGGIIDKIKILVNNEEKKEVDATSLLDGGDSMEVNIELNTGDNVVIVPVLGEGLCPNTYFKQAR